MPGHDRRPKAEGQRPKAEGQEPKAEGQKQNAVGRESNAHQNPKRKRAGPGPNPKRKRAGIPGNRWQSPNQRQREGSDSRSRQNRRARAEGSDIGTLLEDAIRRRKALLSSPYTNAIRLFNAQADGMDGLVIEKYASVAIAQIHEARCPLDEPSIKNAFEKLIATVGVTSVYRKTFAVDRSTGNATLESQHRDPFPWIGKPAAEEFAALENQIRFLIRPFDGASVGLFLDARDNRRLLRDMADGCRVLNTFAYTCGFSVAATLGGAISTVNIDVSKRYLEWGKRNFAANELPLDEHLFYCCDVFDGFRRLAKQNQKFEIVILDPPTFGRVKGGNPFVFEKDLPHLIAATFESLVPGGRILLSTNHRRTTLKRLEAAIAAAAPRRFQFVERPALPPDFSGDPDYSKSLWIEA